MRTDDQVTLKAITDASRTDALKCAHLVHQYYGDAARAEHAPRELMIYHLGLLSGVIERLEGAIRNATL